METMMESLGRWSICDTEKAPVVMVDERVDTHQVLEYSDEGAFGIAGRL